VVQHFLLTASRSFLLPVFPRTALLAQHHGGVQAASRAPDEHVGTGAAYHLFRLPEASEHGIHPAFQDGRGAGAALKGTGDRDAALSFLIGGTKLSGTPPREGPTLIADARSLRDRSPWETVASCDAHAFATGTRVYPYLSEPR
jgi:hypothetical protein